MTINGLNYRRFDPFRIENCIPDIGLKYRVTPKLKKSLPKKGQYIERNPESTTIFDFNKNTLHTFYLKKYKTELKQFRLGPYLLAPFLNAFSAAMIHCSAISITGRVAVFLAPDEGGKTTAVKLASDGIVLCDDQNIVRKEKNEYNIYGTPWGMIANNFSGPVGAFFIIEKAEKFDLTAIHPDLLLSYLWNEHLPYLFFLPKEFSQRHFNFLYELSRTIPAYQMYFPKNHIDWDAVEKAMGN